MGDAVFNVHQLATAPPTEVARALAELFSGEPTRAYDALAPALTSEQIASRAGASLVAEVLAWLAGDSAAARQSVDARARRLRNENTMSDRLEELVRDAQRAARRHWQEEPRWRAAVLTVAQAGTVSTDSLWKLAGLAALELSDDDAWSALDPLLTPANLVKKGGAEFALERVLGDPTDLAPDRRRRFHFRLASPRIMGRLAELARSKPLFEPARTHMLRGMTSAVAAGDGRAFEAGSAVLAVEGPLARELLDALSDDEKSQAELARDPRWLGALSAVMTRKSGVVRDMAGYLIDRVLRRILALPPAVSFGSLERYLDPQVLNDRACSGVASRLPSAVSDLGPAAVTQLVESEQRWARSLFGCASADPKLAEELPFATLLRGLFAHEPGAVFEMLAPLLAPPAGRKPPKLLEAVAWFLALSLGPDDEDHGAAEDKRRVQAHLEREPRWFDVVLSWARWDRTESLDVSRALRFLVAKSALPADELVQKIGRLLPAAAMKDDEAERTATLLSALADDPRLDHPAFLDRAAACLAANPKRAWILEGVARRLVAQRDARVIPSLLAMLEGMNIPSSLPDMLRPMRDPRVAKAIVGALPKMPPDLLPGLHDVLRAHGDASVVAALAKLAVGKGKAAILAKETIRLLSHGT